MSDNHNLAQRSFKAAALVLIFQFTQQFLHILLGIVMVRILSPEDYGVLGVLGVFWAISGIFINGGFGSALLQRKEVTQTDLSSVFYYNMFLALICCFAMMASAPWLADFFNRPILRQTIMVSAWTLPIGTLASMQRIILSRQLKQGINTLCGLLGFFVSGTTALILAWKGYGVWALVWQSFASTLAGTVFLFLFVRWLPSLVISFKSLASLFAYGSKLMVSGLLDCVFVNFYNLIIGKFYPIIDLGYYEKARGYASLWPTSIQGAISGVLFPAFSKIQDDPKRLYRAFHRALNVSFFVIVFPSILLAVLAKPMIELVLLPKWLPILPYWRILTFSFMLWPLHVLNLQLLMARGRSDLFLKLEIIKKILILVNIVATVWFNIIYMVYGMAISSIISAYLNSYYTGKEMRYTFLKQVQTLIPYVVTTVISCSCAWGTYTLLSMYSEWVGFLTSALIGTVVYLFLNQLWQTDGYTDILRIIMERYPAFRKRFAFLLKK